MVSGAVTQRSTTALNLGDQITSVTNAILTTGPQLSKFSYTYDKVGNRLSMTGPAGLINYAYSPTYELNGTTGAQTHSFTYDLLGNRQTANGVAYAANNLNQYSAVGGTAYTYDTNGNLAGNGVSAYTYDEANRLSQVVKGGVTSQYKYDPFYRRASKTVGAATTYYIYDGDHIIEERNSSGALVADYTYGPNIDEALTMTRGGQTYYYHHDALGSVRNLTNAAGAIVESYDYDPYGNLATTSAVGNPILFTGRWYDAESGIYDYRARAYDPKIGRFLQRDPIGYYDSMNLFSYVRNNPLKWTDPLGLRIYRITIRTIIRPPFFIEQGNKSTQTLTVDTDKGTVQSEFTPGNTVDPFGNQWPGQGNNFSATTTPDCEKGEVNVDAKGQTRSAMLPLGPYINYDFNFQFDKDGNLVGISGHHDGFPSYTVDVDGKNVYDFNQHRFWDLTGDGDDVYFFQPMRM